MNNNSFAQRLRLALDIRNMKQIDLAEKSGVSRSLISAYLKGDYEAKQDKIFLIAQALNVNEGWLMGLEVPMEKTLDDNIQKSMFEIVDRLFEDEDEELINLVTNINKLDKNEFKLVSQMVSAFVQKKKD